jgi:hypothetical protein
MSRMPAVTHGIEIVGPSTDLNELKMETNEKMEEYAKAFIDGVQICETSRGWVILFWYRII